MKCQIAFNKLRPGGECEEQLEPTHTLHNGLKMKKFVFRFCRQNWDNWQSSLEKFCFSGFMDFWNRVNNYFTFLGDLSSLCPSATVQIGSVILCFMLNQTVLELINIDNHSKFA